MRPKLFAFLIPLMLAAASALAQTAPAQEPLLSISRLSLGVGYQYRWQRGLDAKSELVAAAAYNIVPRFSLVGSSIVPMGRDAEPVRFTLGVRLVVFKGKEDAVR